MNIYEKIQNWLFDVFLKHHPLLTILIGLIIIYFNNSHFKTLFSLKYFRDVIKVIILLILVFYIIDCTIRVFNFIKNIYLKYIHQYEIKKDLISFRSNRSIYFKENIILDILLEKKLQKFELDILDHNFFYEIISNIYEYCDEEVPNEEDLRTQAANLSRCAKDFPSKIEKSVDLLTQRCFAEKIGVRQYKISNNSWRYLFKQIEKREKESRKIQKANEKRRKNFIKTKEKTTKTASRG